MGKFIKEEYVYPLPSFARSESPLAYESNYCIGGCLRIESNRSNPGLHSLHWIPRRFTPFAYRDLVSHSNDSRICLERMPTICSGSVNRATTKLAGRSCHHIHLAFVDECFPILGLVLAQQHGKHIKMHNETWGLVNKDVSNL